MGIVIRHGADWEGLGASLNAGMQGIQQQQQFEEAQRARKFQESMQSDAAQRAADENARANDEWKARKAEIDRQNKARGEQGQALDSGFDAEAQPKDIQVPIPTPFGLIQGTAPQVPTGLPKELWGSYKQVHDKLKTLDDPEAKRTLLDQWHKAAIEHSNMQSLDEFGKRVGADRMHGVFQSDPNAAPDPQEQDLINRQSDITTTLAQLKQRAQSGQPVDWNQLHEVQKQYDDLQTQVIGVRKERADRGFVIGQIQNRMQGFSGSLKLTQKANDLIERIRMRKTDAGEGLKELDSITNEPDLWGDGTQSFEDADIKTRGQIQREAAKDALTHLQNSEEYKAASLDDRRKMEDDATAFYTRAHAQSYGWRTDVPGSKPKPQAKLPPEFQVIMPLYQAFVQQNGRQPTRAEFIQFAQSQGGGGGGAGGAPATDSTDRFTQPFAPGEVGGAQSGQPAAQPQQSPEDAPLPEGVFDPIESGMMRIGSKSGRRDAYMRKLQAMAQDVADYQNDPQHTASSNAPINLFGPTKPGKKLAGHDDQSQEAFSQLSAAIDDFEKRYGPMSDDERKKLEGMKWAKK